MRSLGRAALGAWVLPALWSCSSDAPVVNEQAAATRENTFMVVPGDMEGTPLKEAWAYEHDKEIAGLCYDKGLIILWTADNELLRLDPATGLPIEYRLRLKGPLKYAPAVYRYPRGTAGNDEIYLVQQGDSLCCIEAETLLQLWSEELGFGVASAPAAGEKVVYVTAEGGRINTFRKENRSQGWTHSAGKSVTAAPVLAGEMLYMASEDGNVYALNALGGWVNGRSWAGKTKARIKTQPVAYQQRVFAASHDYFLYAFDANDGNVAWKFPTGRIVNDQPYACSDTVFCIGEDIREGERVLFAVSSMNGKPRWKRSVPGPEGRTYDEVGVPGVGTFICPGKELVYVLAKDAPEIWALSLANGKLVHRIRLTQRPDLVVSHDAEQGRDEAARGLVLMAVKKGSGEGARIIALRERRVYRSAEPAPKAEEPKAEEPKVEEPKVEEPKVEEPKVEEPKAEEPKVEEPKVEEPAEEPAEEPKAEEPAEEPKAEEPAEEPEQK